MQPLTLQQCLVTRVRIALSRVVSTSCSQIRAVLSPGTAAVEEVIFLQKQHVFWGVVKNGASLAFMGRGERLWAEAGLVEHGLNVLLT